MYSIVLLLIPCFFPFLVYFYLQFEIWHIKSLYWGNIEILWRKYTGGIILNLNYDRIYDKNEDKKRERSGEAMHYIQSKYHIYTFPNLIYLWSWIWYSLRCMWWLWRWWPWRWRINTGRIVVLLYRCMLILTGDL